jgi:Ca2+-binding EF-hand superfamily protein
MMTFYSDNVLSTLSLIITGALDTEQAIKALSELVDDEVTYEQIIAVLNEFDKDGNGVIDMSEFAVMAVRNLKVLSKRQKIKCNVV